MKRELPKYEIEGTPFIADVMKGELREAANPANIIRFDELYYTGTSYTMQYDRGLKNLPDFFRESAENIRYVEIPQMTRLDPEGMAEKYQLPVDEVKRKSDFELAVDQEQLGQRLKGILPKINIAGRDYTVDVRLEELRPVTEPFLPIRFSELHGDEDRYRAFYNKDTHQVAKLDMDHITEIPKGIIAIEIPYEWALDPVGMSRKHDCNPVDMLMKYPIPAELKAKEIPIAETLLPYTVMENRRKQKGTELLLKEKNRKPRRGRRR